MNDTHGASGEGWIGFDLDGTLAKSDGWKGLDHIGEPIEAIVRLAKKFHAEGKRVKILTARVAPRLCGETHATGCKCGHCGKEASRPPVMQEQYLAKLDGRGLSFKRTASSYIREWCGKHLGFIPEIVHQKDHLMLVLYDDRVKQVIPNKGILVEDQANYYESLVEAYVEAYRPRRHVFMDERRNYTDNEIRDQAHKFLTEAELPADRIDFLLDELGFMRMPASIHHHLNHPGGLARHSVNVTRRLVALTDAFGVSWPRKESPYLVGMLHDLVKCPCRGGRRAGVGVCAAGVSRARGMLRRDRGGAGNPADARGDRGDHVPHGAVGSR